MAPATSQSRHRRRDDASFAAIILGLGAVHAYADPPVLQIDWSVNGGPVNTVLPQATGETGSPDFNFAGETADPATGIVLGYDLDAEPYSGLRGNLRVFNDMDSPIDLSIQVVTEFTPIFVEGSDLSAIVTIGLETAAGGGKIESLPPALWRAVVDGTALGTPASLYHHPFIMANSGNGSSSTQQNFGIPFPIPGPPVTDSVGFTLAYSVTSLDLASITSEFLAAGTPLTCAGDLDINGAVGPDDMDLLLDAWGVCVGEPCAADLDGNGVIGIEDLLALLAGWGDCQQ